MTYCIVKGGDKFSLLNFNTCAMEEVVWWTAALTELPVVGVGYMWEENWEMWKDYEE